MAIAALVDPLAGPVIAVVAVLGLSAVLRWTFSPTRREQAVREEGFGSLVPVLSTPDEARARFVAESLTDAGVRANVVQTPASARVQVDAQGHVLVQARPFLVLVFSDDADVARALLNP